MSDDAQIVRGNQCAVCFDHGDSSGSGRLVVAHEGCIDRLEAENEHLRRYEDRGDFLVYRSEWETLHRTINDLRERMEIMRQTLARAEAERDAAREKNRLLWTERGEILGRAQDAEAARDRLREALERIRDNVGWGDYFACACIAEPDKGHMTCTCAGGLRRIAREALGGHQ